MSSVQYHDLAPSNDQSLFQEFDSIDFEMIVPNRKLLKNSVMFECNLNYVYKTGTTDLAVGDDIKLDSRIGFHGLCESWNISSAQQGQIQNLHNYGRYVSTVASSSLDANDYCNINYQAEGRGVTEEQGCYVVQKVRVRNSQVVTYAQDVCFSPKIALNAMVGDDYSFNKNGSLRVSMNLARNNNFLFGKDFADTTYSISNVRLKFMTVPDDGKQGKMLMNSVVSVKSAINSNSVNLLFKVPAKACNGVVMNFIQQSRENTNTENSYALENLPNITSLQMLFNSNTRQGISYEVLDRGEMIENGVNALSESGHNQVSSSKVSVNNGFIIGQSFEEYVDLSSQSFMVNIKHETPAISTNQRLIYLYFLNLVEL